MNTLDWTKLGVLRGSTTVVGDMNTLDWTKLWELRGSTTVVGEERWVIKWPRLRLLERVRLFFKARPAGEETL